MPRVIWKGAISFGLLRVPVALYPESSEIGIDFDWLDRRTMDPVGYQRVNKRTGEEVESAHIVRGAKLAGGD
jgi:DNA end-binding protein Ku